MKTIIENKIKEILKNLAIEGGDFSIEHPEDFKNGDFSVTDLTNLYLEVIKNKNSDINAYLETFEVKEQINKALMFTNI